MDSSRSLSTWRYFGRVAFHAGPDHRHLPTPHDPEAVRAWSEGYRLAWCFWYQRLPSSPIDQSSLEADLQRALQGEDDGNACNHASAHRPLVRLH